MRETQIGDMRPACPPPSLPKSSIERSSIRGSIARWARAKPGGGADFLLARAADELGDRLSLVKRRFPLAADFGSPGPHAAAALAAGGQVDRVVRLAPTLSSLRTGQFLGAVGDIERLPAAESRFDLAVSLLALQTVNDLPGALIQIRRALAPDGLLMAALIGGDTLTELRQSFTIAESEILGEPRPASRPSSKSARWDRSPSAPDWRFRWSISTARPVRYSDLFALLADLRAFGAVERASCAQPQAVAARSACPRRHGLRGEIFRSGRPAARDLRHSLALRLVAAREPAEAVEAGLGDGAPGRRPERPPLRRTRAFAASA